MTNEKPKSSPCTVISTIAVQSANTQLILALLKSDKCLQIKIIEMEPGLTELGNKLYQALSFQTSHNNVLTQLQNKQNPVEELLKQADQLLETKNAKAEIYAEMADNLGSAWKDIHILLEKRKKILDLNVSYHQSADDYFQKINELICMCDKTLQNPSLTEIRQKLSALNDIRRSILDDLKTTLRTGTELLIQLKDIENEAPKLDIRPDVINIKAKQAIAQVEAWFQIVGEKRKMFESRFCYEKMRLEAHSSLSVFDKEFNELHNRTQDYEKIIDQHSQHYKLGGGLELSQFYVNENDNLIKELNALREHSLKLTHSIEPNQVTKQIPQYQYQQEKYRKQDIDKDLLTSYTRKSYNLLDKLNNLISILNEQNVIVFVINDFLAQRDKITKEIDEVERNINRKELIDKLRSQYDGLKNTEIENYLKNGKSIIDSIDKLNLPNKTNMKNFVHEIEDKVKNLNLKFEEQLETNKQVLEILKSFHQDYDKLNRNLEEIQNDFLTRKHKLGHNLNSSKDYFNEMSKYLQLIQIRGLEINDLFNNLPKVLDNHNIDRENIEHKVEYLHNKWTQLKSEIEQRLDLSTNLVEFHLEATNLINEIDQLNNSFEENLTGDNDDLIVFQDKFSQIKLQIDEMENLASIFIKKIDNNAKKLSLETIDSVDSIRSIVDQLLKKRTDFQQIFQPKIEVRELSYQWDKVMEDSLMIVNVATKLRSQLYPIAAFEFTSLSDLIIELKRKQSSMLPQLEKVLSEIDSKIRESEGLSLKSKEICDQSETIVCKLKDLRTNLRDIISDYTIVIKELIEYFLKLQEFDRKLEFEDLDLASLNLKDSDFQKNQFSSDLLELEQVQDNLIRKIQSKESSTCAERDANVLISVFQEQKLHLKEILEKRHYEFEMKQREIQFESNLHGIYKALDQLTLQLTEIKNNLGDTLPIIQNNCQIFNKFEKTTEILNEKIFKFCNQDVQIDDNIKSTKLTELNERWLIFEKEIKSVKVLLNKALYYIDLIEQAQNWIDNGNCLLNEISEKSNLICSVMEAKTLQSEIESFLQPGEQYQNERINEIAKLAIELFNESKANVCAQKVIDNNKNVMTSFAKIENELNVLAFKFQNKNIEPSMTLPEFLVPLTNIMLKEGDLLKLECIVNGEPEPFIKWSFNGEFLKDSDQFQILNDMGKLTLIKSEVTTNDEGYYCVHARNRMGDVNSSCNVYVKNQPIDVNKPTEIRQTIKPKIQSPLRDLKVNTCEEANLECVIIGEPEPEVIWYHDSSLVKESPEVKLQFQGDKCSLILKSTVFEDAGYYKVVAINSGGEASSLCYLTVETHGIKSESMKESLPNGSVPVLNKGLSNTTVNECKEVVLECNCSDFETFKWFHNNREIHQNEKYQFFNDVTSKKIGITICKTTPTDDGEYTIYLTNPRGQISSSARLTVKAAPAIVKEVPKSDHNKMETRKYEYEIEQKTKTIQKTTFHNETKRKPQAPRLISGLTGKIVDQGANVIFDCTYDGYPSPKVTWKKNGVELQPDNNFEIKQYSNKCILELRNVKSDNSGKYTCVLTNSVGVVTSTGDLVVKKSTFPPVFGRRLQAQVIKKGDRAVMEVEITGTPEPVVNWFKDNLPITSALKATDFQKKSFGERHQLTIHEVNLEHSGQFMVKATNSTGEAQSIADFAVFEPTPENMVEVARTVIYESSEKENNINNKSVSEPYQLCNKPVENNQTFTLPSADLINKDDKVSSKSFEESRLYFIEKLSKTEIGSNNKVTKTRRTPSSTETQNTCNNNLKIKRILNNRSISPRAEAIEMEKLWATSNINNNNNNNNNNNSNSNSNSKFERNEGYHTIYESKNSLNYKKQSNEKITPTYDMLTPGSPPTYMSSSNNSKLNIRSQSESGYMADTEDIQQQRQQQLYALSQSDKGENVSEIVQKFESEKLNSNDSSNNSSNIKPHFTYKENEQEVNLSQTNTANSRKTDSKKVKIIPVPSPTKFFKTEFQDSEYESDYIDNHISTMWRHSNGNKTEPIYKPVRTTLTPQNVTKTKFESTISPSQIVYKPKPVNVKNQILYRNDNEIVLKPGSPPEILFMQQNDNQYQSGPKPVYYWATATQTQQKVHKKDTQNRLKIAGNESCGIALKTMTLQQSQKFSKFEDNSCRQIDFCNGEKSKKSSQGQNKEIFKNYTTSDIQESDYESELESIKMKTIWKPQPYDCNRRNEPYYRPVKAPTNIRSSSVPVPHERVLTPMEFDVQLPKMTSKLSTLDQVLEDRLLFKNMDLKSVSNTVSTCGKQENQQRSSYSFENRKNNQGHINGTNMDTANRNEIQYSKNGKSQIDPKIGSLYMKYNFGYEFRLLGRNSEKNNEKFPHTNNNKPKIESNRRHSDIIIPVQHENEKSNSNETCVKIRTNKGAKSEMSSETENNYQAEEHSSSSPLSLSPSLPSNSPRVSNWSTLHKWNCSKNVEIAPPSTPTTPVNFFVTKNPPYFITPLRDIAVLRGRVARFECIVQSEQTPLITWSANGHLIEHCAKYDIYYRNGVCRLTISDVLFDDMGTYMCTATNQTDSVNTSGSLQVKDDKRYSLIF